ncbi:hypothetical protein BaRGS_00020061 [Batillaria attramentaria]|uniref:Uncharacterized protein n=1 Tax=Batillaria attramentaria TaxID=370345 RepID=A0ABD0KNW1_9CAEN
MYTWIRTPPFRLQFLILKAAAKCASRLEKGDCFLSLLSMVTQALKANNETTHLQRKQLPSAGRRPVVGSSSSDSRRASSMAVSLDETANQSQKQHQLQVIRILCRPMLFAVCQLEP